MLHGEKICDGLLDIQRCAICSLQANGLPLAAAKIATRTPAWFNRTLERGNRSGGIWTALRMRELIRLRHEAFRQLMREADGIVAVADWVRTLLLRNGVPEEKITLSRHGLASFASAACIDPRLKPLRVAFLARADKIKGAETLIKAVRAAPDLDLEVHLYVLAQSAGDAKHLATLKSLAGDDTRIALRPPVPHHQVIGMLGTYHLVAVPSRWLETGPLVVLEAFAAGTPVIGSRLGGIAELVRHEENGLLIDSMDISEWTAALRVCAQDRNLLIKLRKGVTRPKSMAQVARDMLGMYEARRANSADSRFVGAGI
jgi:glycosyltransferase involved in cell wall biosynthesis